AGLPEVDASRVGVMGHSYGGKGAEFAAAFDDRFACCVVSDPRIVFEERRANVDYWEPWDLRYQPSKWRKPRLVTPDTPRPGAYPRLVEAGHDLPGALALPAPRPLLVSGGSEDPPAQWQALNHVVAVNRLLGFEDRVAMTNRPGHSPTAESNAQLYAFV